LEFAIIPALKQAIAKSTGEPTDQDWNLWKDCYQEQVGIKAAQSGGRINGMAHLLKVKQSC
jgi:hypothetical protein